MHFGENTVCGCLTNVQLSMKTMTYMLDASETKLSSICVHAQLTENDIVLKLALCKTFKLLFKPTWEAYSAIRASDK